MIINFLIIIQVLMDIIIEKLGEIGVAIIFMLPAIGTFSEILYKTMT